MCNDLNDQFLQGNHPRIFQLRKAISALKKNYKSMSDYYTDLKAYWDELANYKQNMPQCLVGKTLRFFEEIQQE